EGLEVLLAGPKDDVGGKPRPRGLLVPGDPQEMVPDKLLVVARGRAAGRVAVSRPIARGIRREDLVYEGKAPRGVRSELELRVGQYHSRILRPIVAHAVQGEARLLDSSVKVRAHPGRSLGVVQGRVVASPGGLRRGSEDRLR